MTQGVSSTRSQHYKANQKSQEPSPSIIKEKTFSTPPTPGNNVLPSLSTIHDNGQKTSLLNLKGHNVLLKQFEYSNKLHFIEVWIIIYMIYTNCWIYTFLIAQYGTMKCMIATMRFNNNLMDLIPSCSLKTPKFSICRISSRNVKLLKNFTANKL